VQQPNPALQEAEIIIVTHNASIAAMKHVTHNLAGSPVVKSIKSVYRVEG
jgi:homoserine dehydrogenase